ncbi:MAG: hypothetical protein EBQ83_06160, partial [Burkholderiaceae bacterium]|nr:hypothetical protein [Burkholderiaceae bacterium]
MPSSKYGFINPKTWFGIQAQNRFLACAHWDCPDRIFSIHYSAFKRLLPKLYRLGLAPHRSHSNHVDFRILLSRLFIKLKYTELNYRTIAITGTLTIALGDLIHRYLGNKLGVELVSMDRRMGIILLQGCFWFPAFLIIGSKRTEIFEQFREYERRLVIATRARSRTSDEFAEIQRNIQNRIKS